MIAAIESALDELGVVHRRFGPFVVMSFDCGLAGYELSVPVDLHVSGGYAIGRAFLFGPVASDSREVVALFVAFASAQLAGAKLVMEDANVLVQIEEPLEDVDLAARVPDLLRRLLSAAQLVALEVVSLATDPTVQGLAVSLLYEPFTAAAEEDIHGGDSLAGLVEAPVNQAHVVMARRGRPRTASVDGSVPEGA